MAKKSKSGYSLLSGPLDTEMGVQGGLGGDKLPVDGPLAKGKEWSSTPDPLGLVYAKGTKATKDINDESVENVSADYTN